MNTLLIWVLLFFTISFFGWIVEIIVTYIETKKIVNRGFLMGPIVPIYGVGSLLIYFFLSKYNDDPLVLFLLSVILCTGLEYFTSYMMEKIFKNRWWDYTHKKYNINGRVCLENGILFGVGGVILIYGLLPLLLKIYTAINPLVIAFITYIFVILFIADFFISFNIILTLKNISHSIKSDSTEIITKKVKQILSKKTLPYRRLLESFPDMKVFNTMSLLKDKIIETKNQLKREKKK